MNSNNIESKIKGLKLAPEFSHKLQQQADERVLWFSLELAEIAKRIGKYTTDGAYTLHNGDLRATLKFAHALSSALDVPVIIKATISGVDMFGLMGECHRTSQNYSVYLETIYNLFSK